MKWLGFLVVSFFTLMSAHAEEIRSVYVEQDDQFFQTSDPLSQVWSDVHETKVMLFPQNIATPGMMTGSVMHAHVKTVHNDTWFAVRLEWKDATRDVHLETDLSSDACAVQLPLKSVEKTSPFMGNKNQQVAILHWKALWQEDIENGYQEVKDLYPNTWTDTDRFGKSVAIDAKNPVALQKRKVPVEELLAEGFGTLTTQKKQNALGRGVWKDGAWHVVFVRKLKTGDKQDPILKSGIPTSLGFAVWDGSHDDRGGRKNYAPWIALTLEGKK